MSTSPVFSQESDTCLESVTLFSGSQTQIDKTCLKSRKCKLDRWTEQPEKEDRMTTYQTWDHFSRWNNIIQSWNKQQDTWPHILSLRVSEGFLKQESMILLIESPTPLFWIIFCQFRRVNLKFSQNIITELIHFFITKLFTLLNGVWDENGTLDTFRRHPDPPIHTRSHFKLMLLSQSR